MIEDTLCKIIYIEIYKSGNIYIYIYIYITEWWYDDMSPE